MKKDNQNEKPKLILRKKYLDEMEAENLSIEEFLDKRMREHQRAEKMLFEQQVNNATPLKFVKDISINHNLENLGYERRFFTREDAEFLNQLIKKWEDENSIWELIESSPEDKEDLIQTLIQTGVCYEFKNLGVTLYTTWRFDESVYSDSSSILYGNISYYYNHFSKEFKEINEEELFDIEFSA